MSVTNFPSRAQIEQAGDLDFTPRGAAERMPILLELAPDGSHIRCEYTGTLASIPAAVKRLMDAGLVDLVRSHSAAPAAGQARTPKAERVTPAYNADGDPCCPKHHKVLNEGRWGLYCPAKDDTTARGYCSLKFAE